MGGFGGYLPPIPAPEYGLLHAPRLPSFGMSAFASPEPPSPPADEVDATVVAAMARGDERAAARLYDRFGALVYGIALRVTGDRTDADEVVLEVFAQAWREAARFAETRGSVTAWITVLARSRALDCVRSRTRRARATERAALDTEAPAMGQAPASAEVHVEQRERASAVSQALDGLPLPQRRAIELAYFEGLTHLEIADRLQEPLGTVKTRIRLGLLKLRDTLGPWRFRAEESH